MKKIINFYQQQTRLTDDMQKELVRLEQARESFLHQDILTADNEKFLEICELEIKLLNQSAMDTALHIGKVLVSVKENLSHGKFCPWVRLNLKMSHRSANNLMILYQVTLDHPEWSMWPRSIIYELGCKPFNKKLRNMIANSLQQLYPPSHQELLAIKVGIANGTVKPDGSTVAQYFKKKVDINIEERLRTIDGKIIRSLDQLVKDHNTFMPQQSDLAGGKINNCFTSHIKFIVEILNSAIQAIKKGPSTLSAVAAQTDSGHSEHPPQMNLDASVLTCSILAKTCVFNNRGDDDISDEDFISHEKDKLKDVLCPEDYNNRGDDDISDEDFISHEKDKLKNVIVPEDSNSVGNEDDDDD